MRSPSVSRREHQTVNKEVGGISGAEGTGAQSRVTRRTVLQGTAGALAACAVSRPVTAEATGPTVYVGNHDGTLYALNGDSGEQEWTVGTGDVIESSPTVADGTVYVGSLDYNVYAVDAEDGSVQWTYEADGQVRSSPAIVNGTVYVGCLFSEVDDDNNPIGGTLYALDAASGEQKWTVENGPGFVSSPTVVDSFVFVGSQDSNVYALDAASGEQEWVFEAGNTVESSPTVVDDTVFIMSGTGGGTGIVYALDATSGEQEWTFEEDCTHTESSPTVVDETVFVGGCELHALDSATGEEMWSYSAGYRYAVVSSPTVWNGSVFVGSDELYAVDAASGDWEWVFEADMQFHSSPTVVTDPANGYSVGSRVLHGTLGHHEDWHYSNQTINIGDGQGGTSEDSVDDQGGASEDDVDNQGGTSGDGVDDDQDGSSTGGQGPGFGIGGAVAALGGMSYLLIRWFKRNNET